MIPEPEHPVTLIGKDTWQTPIVIPLETDFPIPWDQIDVGVAQKKKQLQDEAAQA